MENAAPNIYPEGNGPDNKGLGFHESCNHFLRFI